MANAPVWIIDLLVTLIRAIFKAEKTKAPGANKREAVVKEASAKLPTGASLADYTGYFSLILRLIEAIVNVLNDVFGKNGWGNDVETDPK